MTLHRRTHPQPVEGCFGCKVASLTLSRGVTRTLDEKKRTMRLDTYERARKEGSKPRATGFYPNQSEDEPTRALRESDRLGRAFRADDLASTYYPDIAKELVGAPPVSIKEPSDV